MMLEIVELELAPLSLRRRPGGGVVSYARAFVRSLGEMRWRRPDVAVAFGSYASIPPALAALSLGIPLVIHEQNVVPGRANRLLAWAAMRCAVSFPETLSRVPSWGKKAVVTGNPLLRPPGKGDRREALVHFGLEEGRFTLGVVGGSQGARTLNRAVREAVSLWAGRDDLQLVHSVGEKDYGELAGLASRGDGGLIYRPFTFIERMDLLYEVADLMVCRAGAGTVSELAAYGCASILVPFPHAGGHQEDNARVLAEAGAALVCKDEEFNGRKLKDMVEELMADGPRLEEMKRRAAARGRPGAAAALADLVLQVAGEGR
jgi:UDP-N-acetylglucosamine--N-acetylmuramyl-(pentapeptide) pyrophosphoryl-undecaprenol N-acetylglucosamine transferase